MDQSIVKRALAYIFPIRKRVIAQGFAHMLVLVVAYVVARQGGKLDAQTSAEIAGLASVIGGMLAGWLVKEFPEYVVNGAQANAGAPEAKAEGARTPPGVELRTGTVRVIGEGREPAGGG